MENLNLQFFAEEDSGESAQEPVTYTQQQYEEALAKQQQGFKSQLEREKKKLLKEIPQVKEESANVETSKDDLVSQILEQNQLLTQRLENIEKNASQTQEQIRKKELLERGVPQEQLDIVYQASSSLQGDAKDTLINQFIPKQTMSTPPINEQQKQSSAQVDDAELGSIADSYLK